MLHQLALLVLPLWVSTAILEPIPDKLVVLTFDDSVKSHHSVVRPILKKYGFGATFFVTEGFDFPTNKTDYMTWAEIAELNADGFEIGNHTRDHFGVKPGNAGQLAEQVRAIADRCREHGIPAASLLRLAGERIRPRRLRRARGPGDRPGPARRVAGIHLPRGEGFRLRAGPRPSAPDPLGRRCPARLDDRPVHRRRRAGPERADRRAPVPRRARPRPPVGPHAARTVRGVHEIPRAEWLQGHRHARSPEVRRSGRRPVGPARRGEGPAEAPGRRPVARRLPPAGERRRIAVLAGEHGGIPSLHAGRDRRGDRTLGRRSDERPRAARPRWQVPTRTREGRPDRRAALSRRPSPPDRLPRRRHPPAA